MLTRDDLLTMSRPDLLKVIRDGHSIDPSDLDDTEYAGISLGLPEVVEKLTWKKLKKTFHRDPHTGAQLRPNSSRRASPVQLIARAPAFAQEGRTPSAAGGSPPSGG